MSDGFSLDPRLAGDSVLASEFSERPTHVFVAAGNGSLAAATVRPASTT